jgi:redox-sensitive bicupin YhaK (pirin superfamily)
MIGAEFATSFFSFFSFSHISTDTLPSRLIAFFLSSLFTYMCTYRTSRFHFSFAGHFDPARQSFGCLRVANDDLVTPLNGFGPHPHRDMNILSYVVAGELSHRDSHGTSETLGAGAVQFMSAGAGVVHEEMNLGDTDTVRFLQVWITPDERGRPVTYGSRAWQFADRTNRLQRVARGTGSAADDNVDDDAIPIFQDANVYATIVEQGKEVPFSVAADRQAYIICVEGDGFEVADGVALSTRDGLKVRGPAELRFRGPGHAFIVEMKRGDDDEWQK